MAADLKPIVQDKWIKGLVAVSNRFSIPKGALPFICNLLLAERGALQVCDGSAQISHLAAAPGPWLTLSSYTDSSLVTTRLAAIQKSAAILKIYNFNADPAVQIAWNGVTDIPITAGWLHPQIIEFAGKIIITLGNNQAPQIANAVGGPTGGLGPLGSSSKWVANTLYSYGDVVSESALPHNNWICFGQNTGFTGGGTNSALAGIGPLGQPAGLSGATEPLWNNGTPPQGTFDNALLWQSLTVTDGLQFNGRSNNQAPRGAAHMIQHLGALWAFNTGASPSPDNLDGPTVLRQSAVQNPNSWPVVNIDYVGRDDGTTGTGMAVFTIAEAGIAPNASLILFKDFSTYQVTGLFQTPNFALQQIKTDMGCIAPRSALFATGYGILRLTHLGIAQFGGVQDELISEEIRSYLFGGPGYGSSIGVATLDYANAANSRAALCVNPPMYMLAIPLAPGTQNYYGIPGGDGSLIRVLCYDLIFKGWAVIDLPFKIMSLTQLRIQGQRPQTVAGGGIPGSNAGDGVIRQLQSGDTAWDNPAGGTTPINWRLTTPTVGGATERNYFRRLNIRLHAPVAPPITIAPIFDDQAPPSQTNPAQAAEPSHSGTNPPNIETIATYENESDLVATQSLDQTASSARAHISGSGKMTLEAVTWYSRAKPSKPSGSQI